MSQMLTCPECGYKTPFLTCMQCGATIKAVATDDETPEDAPGTPIKFAPTTEPPVENASTEDMYAQDVDEASIDSTDKTGQYTPNPILRNAFIVLGVVIVLLKIHSFVLGYRLVVSGLTSESAFSFSNVSLPNKIDTANDDLIEALAEYRPFPDKSNDTLPQFMENYLMQYYKSFSFEGWNESVEEESRVVNAFYNVGDVRFEQLASGGKQKAANQELVFRWVIDEEGNIKTANGYAGDCIKGFKTMSLFDKMGAFKDNDKMNALLNRYFEK